MLKYPLSTLPFRALRKGYDLKPAEMKWSDWIAPTLSFLPIVYGIGLISANMVYGLWGFSDFGLQYQRCVYVGCWAILYLAGTSLPTIVFDWSKAKYQDLPSHKRTAAAKRGPLVLALSISAALTYLFFIFFLQAYPKEKRALIVLVSTISIGAGIIVYTSVESIVRDRAMPKHKRSWQNCMVAMFLAIIFGFLQLLIFGTFFAAIPVSIGGGRPDKHRFLLKREAEQLLLSISRNHPECHVQQPPPNGLLQLENASLLHEAQEFDVVWLDDCALVFKLKKSEIESEEWAGAERRH